jgi:hypothetical protein
MLNQDATLNTPYNPAGRGSVIMIFGTGMGPYDRSLADGSIVGSPSANLTNPVQAIFFGPPCRTDPFSCSTLSFSGTVLFAGAAPQQVVGVDQINVKIPDDAIPGTAVRLTLQSAVGVTPVGTGQLQSETTETAWVSFGKQRRVSSSELPKGYQGNTPIRWRPSSESTAGTPGSGSSCPGMPRQ